MSDGDDTVSGFFVCLILIGILACVFAWGHWWGSKSRQEEAIERNYGHLNAEKEFHWNRVPIEKE